MTKFKKYFEAVKFLESLNGIITKNYLLKTHDRSFFINRLKFLLKQIGNPQDRFKYIHVAGTAGKGSTVNLIHEILKEHSFKVGSYYSPHPTTEIERIKVDDTLISPNEFAALVEKIKPAINYCAIKSPYGTPSYFEVFLAIAFLYFKQKKCGYVVLEAGLGGTHDATNIIKSPLISIITNINLDHQEIIGPNLKQIAENKAGIIKKGSIFITAEKRPRLIKIFKEKCRKVGAKYYNYSHLQGEGNTLLAKAAADALNLNEKKTGKAIKRERLACRFELVQKKPKIILDGSHNQAKINKVIEKLKTVKYKRLILIFGLSASKDYKRILNDLLPHTDEVILTKFSNPLRKSADVKIMYNYCCSKRKKALAIIDPWQALKYGQSRQKADDLLLITGSFYLAGELRTNWISEEDILARRSSFKN